MSFCQHEGNLFYDQHTNDEICADCGLVVNDNILFTTEKLVTFELKEQKVSTYVIDLIRDICANKHISEGIQHQAIQLASEKYEGKQGHILAAYCIYITLIKAGDPRKLQEIAAYFDIRPKHLWNYVSEQNRYFIHETKPSHLSPRIYAELDISYKMGKMIDYISDTLNADFQFAPEGILCSVILFLVKEGRLQPINSKIVSFTCGISPSTVRRVKHLLSGPIEREMKRMTLNFSPLP